MCYLRINLYCLFIPLVKAEWKVNLNFLPPITNLTLSWHSVDLEGKSWVTGSHWGSNKADGISICDRPGGFEAVHLLLRIELKLNWQSCQMGSTELLQQVTKLPQGRRLLWISQSGVWVRSDEIWMWTGNAEWWCLARPWSETCPGIKVRDLSGSSCRRTWNVPPLELNGHFYFSRYNGNVLSAELSLILDPCPPLTQGFLHSLHIKSLGLSQFYGLCY